MTELSNEEYRKQARDISRDMVVPPGRRAYCVIWSAIYPVANGTATSGWSGTIRLDKRLTEYQRYIEALLLIQEQQGNDKLPSNAVTTFFSCVPDRTFTQHYWRAFTRDTRSILGWFGKPFHRKPSTEDVARQSYYEAVAKMWRK